MTSKGSKVPWKQNYMKIPTTILARLRKMGNTDIVVSGLVRFRKSDIEAGILSHLGITIADGRVSVPHSAMPDPEIGRYSRFNIEGRVIVRKDLPMTTKTYSVESPNWGDWYNGSHEVTWDRDVYKRQFLSPQGISILMELVEDKESKPTCLIRFSLDSVLSKDSRAFKQDLLFCLNLLQENVGTANIYASDATLAEYLQTTHVNWEILPPGEKDENIARILSGTRLSPEQRKVFEDRYDFLVSLKPEKLIQGTSGFHRYFGGLFTDELVAFENIRYGNAIYVMYESWQELSKRTRLDLLSGSYDGFTRIMHRSGWKKRLRQVIQNKTPKKDGVKKT